MAIVHPDLRSSRLIIQPLTVEHAPAFLAYFERNRAYLERWEPTRSDAFFTLEARRADIERSAEDGARGICARFVALEPGATEIAASINLWNIRRGVAHAATVGYSVDEARAGRGLASEMLATIVGYAFDELELHRIETSYQPENRASGRVLAKNGFIVEGYARDYLFLNGAWRDGVLVSRSNAKWKPPAASV